MLHKDVQEENITSTSHTIINIDNLIQYWATKIAKEHHAKVKHCLYKESEKKLIKKYTKKDIFSDFLRGSITNRNFVSNKSFVKKKIISDRNSEIST